MSGKPPKGVPRYEWPPVPEPRRRLPFWWHCIIGPYSHLLIPLLGMTFVYFLAVISEWFGRSLR